MAKKTEMEKLQIKHKALQDAVGSIYMQVTQEYERGKLEWIEGSLLKALKAAK